MKFAVGTWLDSPDVHHTGDITMYTGSWWWSSPAHARAPRKLLCAV